MQCIVGHVTEMKWNYLLCTTLVFFAIRRISPTSRDNPQCTTNTGEAPDTIRFAPVHLYVQSCEAVAALSPNFFHRRLSIFKLSRHSLLSTSLLLLAGDIEVNPGPKARVRHPCGVCSKAVRSNQKAILCEVCYYWLHAKCIGMSEPEYIDLQNSDEPWCCSTCFREALPFHDVSCLNSTSTDTSKPAS